MKQQPKKGLAKSQTNKLKTVLTAPGPRLAAPAARQPKPPTHPEFAERRDDPAQAEELERQQDA